MPYLGHLFSPPATPQAKHDGRIPYFEVRTISLLRLEISKKNFERTLLLMLWPRLHKQNCGHLGRG